MVNPQTLRQKGIAVLLLAVLLLLLLVKIKTPFNFYDEGLVLNNAVRVSHGDIPYRNFWGIYPPGQFYILSALFKITGENLLPARLYDTLVRFALVIAVFLIVRKIASRGYALWTAGIVALMLATIGFYTYPVFPAVALSLWAVWCWLNYVYTCQNRWLLAAGALLGVTSLIRWDVFLYAAISILITAYLFLRLSAAPGPSWLKQLFAPLPTLIWLLAPMLLISLGGYGLLALYSGWDNLFHQAFYFPAVKLREVRHLAYPSLLPADFPPSDDWRRFYLPIFIFVLAGITYLIILWRKRGRVDPGFYGVLNLILCGAFLFNQGLSRYDYIHVLPSSIPAFMVCMIFSYRALPQMKNRWMKYALYLLMGVSTLVYFNPAVKELRLTFRHFAPWGCYSGLERASCAALDANQEQAVRFIQSVTRPNERIFVGNTRHDRIFVSDVGFYYLAARPAATRYQELHPGEANTLPVQTEIVGELEAHQVQWIVLVGIWDSTEPNDSAKSSGVHLLDDYLAAHYQTVTNFGQYQIARRR